MKKVLGIIGNMITVLLIVIVGLAVAFLLQGRANPGETVSLMGYKMLTVLSGSMSPVFEPGDIIVVKSTGNKNIRAGDIITFEENGTLVTHRVAEVVKSDGKEMLKTKGDANNIKDSGMVDPEHVVGTYKFRIPYGGYVARFARSATGFILLIIVPSVLLIAGEIKNIIAASKKEDRQHTMQ